MKIGVYRGFHPMRLNSFMAVWSALHKSEWVYIELHYTSSWMIEERETFTDILSVFSNKFNTKKLVINLNCDDTADAVDALIKLQDQIISVPNIYVCTYAMKLFTLMQKTLDPKICIGYKILQPQDTGVLSSRINFILLYVKEFSVENVRTLRKTLPDISVYSYVCYDRTDLYSLHRYGSLLDVIFCTATL